jgi:hypothetical protein
MAKQAECHPHLFTSSSKGDTIKLIKYVDLWKHLKHRLDAFVEVLFYCFTKKRGFQIFIMEEIVNFVVENKALDTISTLA